MSEINEMFLLFSIFCFSLTELKLTFIQENLNTFLQKCLTLQSLRNCRQKEIEFENFLKCKGIV
jgi:hypothetical protein